MLSALRLAFAFIRLRVFAVLGGLAVGVSLDFDAALGELVDLVLGELAVDLGARALQGPHALGGFL